MLPRCLSLTYCQIMLKRTVVRDTSLLTAVYNIVAAWRNVKQAKIVSYFRSISFYNYDEPFLDFEPEKVPAVITIGTYTHYIAFDEDAAIEGDKTDKDICDDIKSTVANSSYAEDTSNEDTTCCSLQLLSRLL